jgi:gliding motility-associated lipoprotein GldH
MALLVSFCIGCTDNRVYEEYSDLENREWLVTNKPAFEFTIDDTAARYNVLGNIRNSVSYPYARLFLKFSLQDSTGRELYHDLASQYLFDAKTGKPFGKSGLGDIYDHQTSLLKNYDFGKPGKYKLVLEQYMRTDTLSGVLAVGVRIERAQGTSTTE